MADKVKKDNIRETVLEAMEEVIYVADPETYEILYANPAMEKVWGDCAGRICYEVLQDRSEPCPFCTNDLIFGEYLGRTYVWEFRNEVTKGWFRCNDRAIDWPDGRKVRYEMAVDITKQKEAEEIITRQSQEIMALSIPVIKAWEGVVVAPLIGVFDSERAQRFMEKLLSAVVESKSPVALIDITGVPAIDTQTAQYLIEAVTATRLLGSKVIITGIRPAIAITLTQLGFSMPDVVTEASLAIGFKKALQILGLHIAPRDGGHKKGVGEETSGIEVPQ